MTRLVSPSELAELCSHAGLDGVERISPLTGGFSNANYRVRYARGQAVLRVYHSRPRCLSRNDCLTLASPSPFKSLWRGRG